MYNTQKYDSQYYLKLEERRIKSATGVLGEFFKFYKPASVVDLGCGLGHWLSICKKMGVKEITGYDGNAVDKEFFKIDFDCYRRFDFEKELSPPQRYDLAMTIEVAEHLPASSATTFVKSLTNCSDIVLFSAAAPHQGGVNHFNEQPPAYWNDIFSCLGYVCFDFLRDRLWEKEGVADIHAQNMLIFVKKDKAAIFQKQGFTICERPLLKYHPGLFDTKFKKLIRRQALKNKIRKFFRGLTGKKS